MANYIKSYTKIQEINVIGLFNRPLRKGERIVDNSNKTIATETGLHHQIVNTIITKYLEEKFRLLNLKINSN